MVKKSNEFDIVIFTDVTDTTLIFKSLGAFKLAHICRLNGFKALVVDHFHMWNIGELRNLLSKIISSSTKIIGISTTFFNSTNGNNVYDTNNYQNYTNINFQETFCPQGKEFENQFVSVLKQMNSDCKILLGGHKASPETNNKNVDYIMTGHGEQSIIDLLQLLDNNQNLSMLPNSYKNIFGITIIPGHEISGEKFACGGMEWKDYDVFNAKVLPIEIARGCIFNCSFCSYPLRGKKTLDFVLNHDLMYQEFKNNYEQFGITTYQIVDDTFNDSDEKLDRVLSVVSKLNFQPTFWCYSRLDLAVAKPYRISKMYDIGIRAVHFGIETLNEKIGKTIGKGLSTAKQIEAINGIREKYGDKILLHGSFILGLPGETLESMKNTHDELYSGNLPLHSWNWHAFSLRKFTRYKSEFEKNFESYGLTEMGVVNGKINWSSEITTYEDMIKLQDEWNNMDREIHDFRITSQTAWALLNYPEYNYDIISSLRYKTIDWNHVNKCKIKFVDEYKKNLLDWLN